MEDKEHKRVSRTEIMFKRYEKFHTEVNPDEDIDTVSSKAREYLSLKKHFEKPKAFDFYRFTKVYIEHSNGKNYGKKALEFKDLQSVIQKLEDYGLRLLKRPWRREFFTIKLFTTFFKHDIASKLPNAVKVLELYGYKDVSQNIVKLDYVDQNKIMIVCFELFLSRIELEVMSETCSTIEHYDRGFSLVDVFIARRNTKGDVKETIEYFLTGNPRINRAKRVKTDDMESGWSSRDKFDQSHKHPAEDEETSRTDFDNGRNRSQGRTKRDTKYPPVSDNYINLPSSVNSNAKVRHVSSSVPVDNFSDAELYGHDDASSSQGNNVPMDTQEAQPWKGAAYDPDLYVDMSGANDNYYENLDRYGADNGLSSCTTLPPPPGIPPPTYDQAIQIPGNDWVMVEGKDSDGLSHNISAMNIGENGHGLRTSSEVEGVRGMHSTPVLGKLKAASSDRMDLTTIYSNQTYYRIEPGGTSTKTRTGVSSERPVLNGSHEDYKSPSTSFTKGLDSRQLPEKPALNLSEIPGDTKSKIDIRNRSTSLGSYDKLPTARTTEQHLKSRLTRSGPEELNSKRMSDPSVAKTTTSYMTSSYSNGCSTTTAPYSSSSDTQSGMTTRSQTRKTAANTSEAMSEPLRGTSKTPQKVAERYGEENCIVCRSKATHHCVMCKKRSCKSCTTVVTRLPCESYKEHILVEGSPSTNNERADQGSKDVCSFCGVSAASHDCIYCRKKSCSTCRTVYTKDTCVLSKTPHYFVNQQQQQSTSEKPKISSQTTLSSKDKKPNPFPHGTGETYCDFCGMAANLICKPCLKTICSTCRYAYVQDICPPTKREHQFEDINEQSSNANETQGNDSSSMWSCERCTFLNSSSHRICAVCATSRGVNQVAMPKSGSRKCQNCTYGNEEGATVCKMCSRTVGLDNPESYI